MNRRFYSLYLLMLFDAHEFLLHYMRNRDSKQSYILSKMKMQYYIIVETLRNNHYFFFIDLYIYIYHTHIICICANKIFKAHILKMFIKICYRITFYSRKLIYFFIYTYHII